MGHPHPGQDEKAGIVGEEMKVLRAPPAVPTDVVVPDRTLPGGGAKKHTGQRTGLSVTNEVLEVFPNAAAVTEIMVLMKERIEEGALARSFIGTRTFTDLQRQQFF